MTQESDSGTADAELIAAVRGGDSEAYAELYRRHAEAARRLARALVRDPADADDLVAETFTRMLATLRGGRGPDVAFRAYLLATLRHACYDRARRDRRLQLTDDLTPYEPGVPFVDPTEAELDRSYAARAFAKLPERWRVVLWHTEVEGESPAQVAPLLGLTPNGVAALAYRARERLRQMYLAEHVATTANTACHQTSDRLAGYVRGTLGARDRSKVDHHLTGCAACTRLQAELAEVNAGLRGVLAPLVLGGSAAAYLGGHGTPAAVGAAWSALWTLPGRSVRRLVDRFGRNNVAAGGGIAAAAVLGAAILVVVLVAQPGGPPRRESAAPAVVDRVDPPVVPLPPIPPTAPPVPTAGTGGPAASDRDAPAAGPRPGAPPQVAPPGSAADLVAGAVGELPLAIRQPEAALSTRTPERLNLALTLPRGMRLAAADAGDSWRCTAAPAGAACTRPPLPSGRTTARIKVAVDDAVTGFQAVVAAISAGGRRAEARFRVAVAPVGMRVAYGVTGRVRAALVGNTLLSCQPRPICLAAPNNQALPMQPYRPGAGEPTPPAGLAQQVPEPVATSGAALPLPDGAGVRWAGLYWAASAGAPPPVVALHGPRTGWQRVVPDGTRRLTTPHRPVAQAWTDVTALVRRGGGGPWWFAAGAGGLPAGDGQYAGWSLVVVHEDPSGPVVDLAAYAGPTGSPVTVAVAGQAGAPIRIGLLAWDGDRGLGGDRLLLGTTALADNVGQGTAAGALECLGAATGCAWNTLGIDVTAVRGALPVRTAGLVVASGDDPMEVGVLTVAAPPPL